MFVQQNCNQGRKGIQIRGNNLLYELLPRKQVKILYLQQDGELAKFLARELSELREAEIKQPCKWMETVVKVKGYFSFRSLTVKCDKGFHHNGSSFSNKVFRNECC